MLVELTAAATRTPIAIEAETIGEVKDLSGRASHNFELYGRTLIYHRNTRRVRWAVAEPYAEVMKRIRGEATAATATGTAATTTGPGRPGAGQSRPENAAQQSHGTILEGRTGTLPAGSSAIGTGTEAPAAVTEAAGKRPDGQNLPV